MEGNIHTQKVERLWRDLKEWLKRPGMKKSHLKHYIGRYLFCTSEEDPDKLLHKFLLQAAALYPPGSERKTSLPSPPDESDDEIEMSDE